ASREVAYESVGGPPFGGSVLRLDTGPLERDSKHSHSGRPHFRNVPAVKRWAGRDPKELGRGSGVRDGGCPEPDPDHRQQGGGCFQHQREDRRLRTKRTPAAAIPIPTATPRSARPGPLPVASATAVARLGLEPDASPSVAAVPALVSADV